MWADLATWLERFLESMAKTLGDRADSTDATASILRLLEFRSACASSPRLRPKLALWSTFDATTSHLVDVAGGYLRALLAPTPIEAQRFAELAQSSIDAAAEAAGAFGEQLERWTTVDSAPSVETAIAALARQSFDVARAASILDVDAAGIRLFELEVGRTPPSGSGVGLWLVHLQAQMVLDEASLWRMTRSAYEAFENQTVRATTMLADDRVRADLELATQLLYDAGIAFHAVVSVAKRDRHAVQALLEHGHALLEGPGRRLLAVALSILKARDHQSLRTKDSSALLDMAGGTALEAVAKLLDRSIRSAKAHADYEVEEGDDLVVILRPGSAQEIRITGDELIDRVLGGLEAVVCLQVSLTVLTAACGLESAEADPLGRLGFSIEEVIETVLGLSGWTVVGVVDEGESIMATGEAPTLSSRSLSIVAGVAVYLPARCERLSLSRVEAGRSVQILDGPLATLREREREQGEFEREAMFLRVCSEWTLDGVPIASRDLIRKWIAMKTGETLKLGHREKVRRLKYMCRLAQLFDDEVLADSLDACISISVNLSLGLPSDQALLSRIDILRDFEARRLPSPF